MLLVTAQTRILVCVEPVDFRKEKGRKKKEASQRKRKHPKSPGQMGGLRERPKPERLGRLGPRFF